jgi:hypothetical protein
MAKRIAKAKPKKTISENIIAGPVVFRRVFERPSQCSVSKKRCRKTNPTTESVQSMNDRMAERNLAILINANFSEGDYSIVLTESETVPERIFRNHMRNFIAKLGRRYGKAGVNLKWVTVVGFGKRSGRIHAHMVISKGIDIREVTSCWGHGHVLPGFLDGDGDYSKLANYLMRQHEGRFREPDAEFKQRYSTSRTVVKPPVYRELVANRTFSEPKPRRGYEIVEGSVSYGANPYTGLRFMEYVERPKNRRTKPRPGTRWRAVKPRATEAAMRRWLKSNGLEQIAMFKDWWTDPSVEDGLFEKEGIAI